MTATEIFTANDPNAPEGDVFFDLASSAGGGAAAIDGHVLVKGGTMKYITHSVLYGEDWEKWDGAVEFDDDGDVRELSPEEDALLAAAGAEFNRRGNGLEGTMLFRNTH